MPRNPPPAARLALAAIRGYQRWISPHKGFSCALRSATGAASCSAYGHDAIARFGLGRGLGLLQRRLALCGHVGRRTAPPPRPPTLPHPRRRREQGFCDIGCDLPGCDLPGCDLPGCDAPGSRLRWCDVLNCGCDVADLYRDKRARESGSRCWPFTASRQRRPSSEQLDALARRIRAQRQRRVQDPS